MAHRLLYHSTRGSRVIKQRRRIQKGLDLDSRGVVGGGWVDRRDGSNARLVRPACAPRPERWSESDKTPFEARLWVTLPVKVRKVTLPIKEVAWQIREERARRTLVATRQAVNIRRLAGNAQDKTLNAKRSKRWLQRPPGPARLRTTPHATQRVNLRTVCPVASVDYWTNAGSESTCR